MTMCCHGELYYTFQSYDFDDHEIIKCWQADDIRNEANELLRIRDYLFSELAKNTGQSLEKVSMLTAQAQKWSTIMSLCLIHLSIASFPFCTSDLNGYSAASKQKHSREISLLNFRLLSVHKVHLFFFFLDCWYVHFFMYWNSINNECAHAD